MVTQLPALQGDASDVPMVSDPQSSMRSKLRIAMIAVAVMVFGFIGGAALLPIGGAVIAVGEVSVESRVKQVAHPTGGVISEILVRDGDRVKKGDVLVRLDTTVSGTSAELSEANVDQLLAQKARLEAEREDRRAIIFPPELTQRQDASARAAMASEARLFQLRRAELSGQQAQLSDRVRQLEQQIQGYSRQISALNQQANIIEPELNGLRKLWEDRLISINRLNQLERTAVDLKGSSAALEARIAEARARISETREQMINLRQSARSAAGAELARVTAQLGEQQIQQVSAGDAFDRSAIRAPHDGVVDKLAVTTVGGVIRPAETILQIVPDNDDLIVQARISPADIDQVQSGQAARVRFSAFNVQTTLETPGKVEFVSAESALDEKTGASFYRLRISVDADALSREQSMRLVPGMPAEVFIETGSRSMLSFILRPLTDQFKRAFRSN